MALRKKFTLPTSHNESIEVIITDLQDGEHKVEFPNAETLITFSQFIDTNFASDSSAGLAELINNHYDYNQGDNAPITFVGGMPAEIKARLIEAGATEEDIQAEAAIAPGTNYALTIDENTNINLKVEGKGANSVVCTLTSVEDAASFAQWIQLNLEMDYNQALTEATEYAANRSDDDLQNISLPITRDHFNLLLPLLVVNNAEDYEVVQQLNIEVVEVEEYKLPAAHNPQAALPSAALLAASMNQVVGAQAQQPQAALAASVSLLGDNRNDDEDLEEGLEMMNLARRNSH
ncbi:MAG: hypothetical protein P4M14_10385 [Gammaproteobacteria bacterium]|nr:hypothetical protein [Gammaproteobacteria bacterium]